MKLSHILIIIIIIGITGCKTPFESENNTPSGPVMNIIPASSDVSNSQGSVIFITQKILDDDNPAEPVIYIAPVTKELSAGDQLSLEIKADNVSDIFASSFSITFDTTLLKFESMTEGTFLNRNNTDHTTFLFFNNPVTGRIDVGLSRMGNSSGISGSGVLMTVRFNAVMKGTANIDFSNMYVKTRGGSDLGTAAINFTGAEVLVK